MPKNRLPFDFGLIRNHHVAAPSSSRRTRSVTSAEGEAERTARRARGQGDRRRRFDRARTTSRKIVTMAQRRCARVHAHQLTTDDRPVLLRRRYADAPS
jgi:hypothetical protein